MRSIKKGLLTRLFSYIRRFGLQDAFNETKTQRILSARYLYFMIKQFIVLFALREKCTASCQVP